MTLPPGAEHREPSDDPEDVRARRAAAVVEQFRAGWRRPDPHAWDHLLGPEVRLEQPLLPNRTGSAALAEEYGRLLRLIPDLRGDVHGWDRHGDSVEVRLTLHGTLGGRPLRLPVTDTLELDDQGLITARRASFDVGPAVRALACSPSAWPGWWRSGVGPFVARRAVTDAHPPDAPERAPGAVVALAVGRLALAVAAWCAPDLSGRLVGLDPAHPEHRYLMRVFAARAAALGLGTLTAPADRRRGWQALGLMVDVSDTVAAAVPGLGPRARLCCLALTGTYVIAGLHHLRIPGNVGREHA